MKSPLLKHPRTLFLSAAVYTTTIGVFYLAATCTPREIAGSAWARIILLTLFFPLLAKYFIQLVCALLSSPTNKRRALQNCPKETLSVSVLIPAWNEEVGIVKTIQSVLDTRYPKLQIIIINDGSTDSTHERVTQFIQRNPIDERERTSLTYLNLSNGGKAEAMNRALVYAQGEIIITIDADSVMDPAAINQLVKQFSDPHVGAVAGNVIIGNRKKPIEWIQQMEYLYGFFFKRADSLFNSVYIIGGAAAAYRKDVLQTVGNFDHNIITEDIEMSTRVLSYGYKTRYAPDAVIYTEGPADVKSLCSQRLRWKYGRILTFIKHRKLFFSMRPNHNPYLTFMLLPLAVYSEILLLAEVFMLLSFFVYTVLTRNYAPLALVILMLTAIVCLQILMDSKRRFHRNLIWLAPIAWLMFYAIDLIEFQALIRSIKRFITGKELKWQKWVRIGVTNDKSTGVFAPAKVCTDG